MTLASFLDDADVLEALFDDGNDENAPNRHLIWW